jgi:GNAT superfamily N-acetyltransferase
VESALVGVLNGERASDACEIVREYMVATELERGNSSVVERGLPDVLERECAELLVRFGPPNRFFLAYAGDALVGCAGVKLVGKDAEISRLYVREAYRTSGIATQLMASAEAYARTRRARRLILDVLPGRERVIEWYRRSGFTDTDPFEDLPMPMVYLAKAL